MEAQLGKAALCFNKKAGEMIPMGQNLKAFSD
jgi:hypothetical protein